MELKKCEYCGTEFDAALRQCPLCGKAVQPGAAEPQPSCPRRLQAGRRTRRKLQQKKGGRFAQARRKTEGNSRGKSHTPSQRA